MKNFIHPHIVQQRQILAEIEVEWWIQNDTVCSDISTISNQFKQTDCLSTKPVSPHTISIERREIIKEAEITLDNNTYLSQPTDLQHNLKTVTHDVSTDTPTIDNLDSHSPQKMADMNVNKDELTDISIGADRTEETINKVNVISNKAIRPFTLQALQYRQWILIADEACLQDNQQQYDLWQSLCQALHKPIERLKFPLVNDVKMIAMSAEPMNTVELANATLAGFVFGMIEEKANMNHVKLAGLTALSEGLDSPLMVDVPLLQDMLADASVKGEFWQLLKS